MNRCQFKEIIVLKDFEVENGLLGLDRDVYLSLVEFLDSSIVRKVLINILLYLFIYFTCNSTLGLMKNHMNKENTSTSRFSD
jgi:hypothetical protein